MDFEIQIRRDSDNYIWERKVPSGGRTDTGDAAIFTTLQKLYELVPAAPREIGDRFIRWLEENTSRQGGDLDFPFPGVLRLDDMVGYTVTIRHEK